MKTPAEPPVSIGAMPVIPTFLICKTALSSSNVAFCFEEERPVSSEQPELTILVVDDYPDSARSFAHLLSMDNFTVNVAHGGDEALQIFDELRPRVVLLDVCMRPLSGFDLARLIRSRATGAQTLLIAVTGYEQDELEKQCHDAGFDAFFRKPVKYSELKKLLTWWHSFNPPALNTI